MSNHLRTERSSFPVYQVDAFTRQLFAGNPACVVVLDSWLPDTLLLKIAQENAVAETAFLCSVEGGYHLRWFTPELEMDLCGHATLAAAHVVHTQLHPGQSLIVFETVSGSIEVVCRDGQYELDLPVRRGRPAVLPAQIEQALNVLPEHVYLARDYMLVYPSRIEVEQIKVDRSVFDQINLGCGGVVCTAPGDHPEDFVSRFFTPQASILEDPVTGSAHCTLVPYWSERLGKEVLQAKQLSDRGGTLRCALNAERVLIAGEAVTYSKGVIYV